MVTMVAHWCRTLDHHCIRIIIETSLEMMNLTKDYYIAVMTLSMCQRFSSSNVFSINPTRMRILSLIMITSSSYSILLITITHTDPIQFNVITFAKLNILLYPFWYKTHRKTSDNSDILLLFIIIISEYLYHVNLLYVVRYIVFMKDTVFEASKYVVLVCRRLDHFPDSLHQECPYRRPCWCGTPPRKCAADVCRW